MTTYAIVDLEATNHPLTNEKYIIQVGITYVEKMMISETLTIDIKPPVAITPTITKLTGITNEQVSQAPLFEDVAEYIATLLDGCVFVAHNVTFDYGLLVDEMNRVGVDFSQKTCMDTIDLAQIVMPTQASFGLKTLAQQLDISLNHHHQAGDDSKATAHLFIHLCEQIQMFPKVMNQDIYRLLHAKQEGIAQLFNHLGSEQTPFVTPNVPVISKTNLQTIHAVLSAPRDSGYQSYTTFIDEDRLTYVKTHPETLTIQEVRQVCRIIVSLYQNNYFGNLSRLQLPQKLIKKLASCHSNNPYYIAYMNHIKQKKELYISYYDFIHDFDDLQQHIDLSSIELMIHERNALQYFARLARTRQVALSVCLSQAFALKSDYAQQNKDTMPIDQVILDLFWVIDFLKMQVGETLNRINPNSVQDSYLGRVSEIDGFLWIRLKNALEKFKSILNQSYITPLDLDIAYVKECLTQKNSAYFIGIHIQKTDYMMHYTLRMQPFSVVSYLDEHVFSSFARVNCLDRLPDTLPVRVYMQLMFSQFDFHSNEEGMIGELIVSRKHASQNWKDNLMVKKVVQYLKKVNHSTLIVVPNQTVVQNIVSNCDVFLVSDVHTLQRFNDKCKEKAYGVVTWRVFYECYSLLEQHIDVVVVKLPFEPPQSVHVQASKDYLSNKENYFTTINVVSTLLDMIQIVTSRYLKGDVIMWDDRIFHSTYGEIFTQGMSEMIKIVEV